MNEIMKIKSLQRLPLRHFSYVMPSRPVHYYDHHRHGQVVPVVAMLEPTHANRWARRGSFVLAPVNLWLAFSLSFNFSHFTLPAVLPSLAPLVHPVVLLPSLVAQCLMSAHVLSRRPYDHHVRLIFLKPCGTKIIVRTWKGL